MNIFDEFDKLDAALEAAKKAPHPQGLPGLGDNYAVSVAHGALSNAYMYHGPKLLALARAARKNRRQGLQIECMNGCPTADSWMCEVCALDVALRAMGEP